MSLICTEALRCFFFFTFKKSTTLSTLRSHLCGRKMKCPHSGRRAVMHRVSSKMEVTHSFARERRKVGVREVWLAVSCFELMMCAQNREEKLP